MGLLKLAWLLTLTDIGPYPPANRKITLTNFNANANNAIIQVVKVFLWEWLLFNLAGSGGHCLEACAAALHQQQLQVFGLRSVAGLQSLVDPM